MKFSIDFVLKQVRRKFNLHKIKIFTASTCLIGLAGFSYHSESFLKKAICEKDDIQIDQINQTLNINECKKIIKQYKEEFGIPGIVVGISKDNEIIFSKGFGYADVENCLKATPDTIMRIASISKPITCTIAAKLYEMNKLDIDKPVNHYIKDLPSFKYQNKEHAITSRQLMCHKAGIRHYKESTKDEKKTGGDAAYDEFYLNRKFKTTNDALSLFINDELLNEPGTKYLYSTFGYTLLSAVLEKASQVKSFETLLNDLFKEFDMKNTFLDQNEPIISNRSKYYMRNDKKRLINVPSIDNSYKWAGGGILSNVTDLIKFGNKMLEIYQNEDQTAKTFLKSQTIKNLFWLPHSNPDDAKTNDSKESLCEPSETISYGLGWNLCFDNNNNLKYAYHTGGALGAVSCLLIIPNNSQTKKELIQPNGIVIAVLCNSHEASQIAKFTLKLANLVN